MRQQKQFRMGFLCCFFKEQKPVSFKKKQKTDIKKQKKQVGWVVFKKTGFSQPLIFQSFCVIFP